MAGDIEYYLDDALDWQMANILEIQGRTGGPIQLKMTITPQTADGNIPAQCDHLSTRRIVA